MKHKQLLRKVVNDFWTFLFVTLSINVGLSILIESPLKFLITMFLVDLLIVALLLFLDRLLTKLIDQETKRNESKYH